MDPTPPLLITGAAGFIGWRFLKDVQAAGYAVLSADHPAHFEARPEHLATDFGNILDRANLISWLETTKPRVRAVIHLGACTDTQELDEAYLAKMNLEYSKALWNFCVATRTPFVYASSAATYGNGELGYSDDESLIQKNRALNPYGESKRLFDLWVLDQERLGRTPPSWSGFKFFNVYGFGERHKGKMASVVFHGFEQIRASGELRLFESHRTEIAHGHQKRDFIHVEDVVSVLRFAFERPISRGIFNLGSGTARTFLDLAKATFAALQKPERITYIPMPEGLRERYQYFTQAEMNRLKDAGYSKPFQSLEVGVSKTIQALLAASSFQPPK